MVGPAIAAPGAEGPRLGFDASWYASFYEEEAFLAGGAPLRGIGRDDYYAELRATLNGGLDGGVFTLRIEGITDTHYAELARVFARRQLVAKLFLYWRDEGALGYLADLVGARRLLDATAQEPAAESLVAVVAVTKLARKAGAHRMELQLEGRALAFDRLATRRVLSEVKGESALELAGAVARTYYAADKVILHPRDGGAASDASQPPAPPPPPELGRLASEVLAQLGSALESESRQYGRGMFSIRAGALHIGPGRPVPLEGPARPLKSENGLVEVKVTGSIPIDPNWDYVAHEGKPAPTRRTYELSLLGRPDLHPGDTVSFAIAPEDERVTGLPGSGVLASVGGALRDSLTSSARSIAGIGAAPEASVMMYIDSVVHHYSRTNGFTTTISGVDVSEGSVWDEHTKAAEARAPTEVTRAAAASPNALSRTAEAMRGVASSVTAAIRLLEVGEVRGAVTETSDSHVSQTVTVFRGLEAGDGKPSQSHRLDIQRTPPSSLSGVPYVSPYAWGKSGLVLPRYPGTRVVLDHRNGYTGDPVDLGALWQAGEAPDSQPGDWWLILPTEVSQRQAIADSDETTLPSGKGTNDLIDADGSRIIEVGELTVRIGRDSLRPLGERPERAQEADAITIEHVDGKARIVITSDGTITIHAGKNLVLEAPDGDIQLNAKNVDVTVSGKMDVK